MKLKILALGLLVFAFHLVEAAEFRTIVHVDDVAQVPPGASVSCYSAVPYCSAYWDDGGIAPDNPAYLPDPQLDPQYGDMANIIDVAGSVANGMGGAGTRVGIIDSGVQSSLFSGRVVAEACRSSGSISFVSTCPTGQWAEGPGSAAPCTGYFDCRHGTAMAWIAANMAPQADVVACQAAVGWPALGRMLYFTSDVLHCLDWMYGLRSGPNAVASVGISIGSASVRTETCDTELPAFEAMLTLFDQAGMAVVIAGGNSGRPGSSTPGCVSSAWHAYATTKGSPPGTGEQILSFSNTPTAAFADRSLWATGENVVSYIPTGQFVPFSGTSPATAGIAGAFAALMSKVSDNHAGATLLANSQPFTGGARIHLTDWDGQPDTTDNCLLAANGPTRPDAGGNYQRDTNADGYGNVCDPDLDNNGVVNFTDLGILASVFGTADPDADLNGDGVVDYSDRDIMMPMFSGSPGPSGIAP